jgi:hypothetical protein
MKTRVTPHFVDLLYNCLLSSFWRKQSMKRFLRTNHIDEKIINSWNDEAETKRSFLDRMFPVIQNDKDGERIFAQLALALIQQNSFPDLIGWENSKELITSATAAKENLRTYIEQQDREIAIEDARTRAKKEFNDKQVSVHRQQAAIDKLSASLISICNELGTQSGGYKFQDWFYEFVKFYDIVHRKPYVTAGRQIDGSITIKDTTYLIELKFTQEQAGSTDIDTFIRKVTTKADNTMGIFISMSGFTSTSIVEASKERTPLLLLDSQHVFMALTGAMPFPDIVDRAKRHASQTGESYLNKERF